MAISLACVIGAVAILLVQEKYAYQYQYKDSQGIPLYKKQSS